MSIPIVERIKCPMNGVMNWLRKPVSQHIRDAASCLLIVETGSDDEGHLVDVKAAQKRYRKERNSAMLKTIFSPQERRKILNP